MKRIRKMLAVILGAVLLMFVAAMFGPRTAHAIVAALVQVVNTPTNAVNELHAPAASAIYENSCDIYVGGGGGNVASCQMPAAPPGETLVVEAVSIFAEPPYPESYAYLSNRKRVLHQFCPNEFGEWILHGHFSRPPVFSLRSRTVLRRSL